MSLKEFDSVLRETVVHRSTLSNTRVERITYICSKNLAMGSQHMASSILEAHKERKAKKVSSLYTLHALVQQGHRAIRKGSRESDDWKTFLSAIESILGDFFDESIKRLDRELKVGLFDETSLNVNPKLKEKSLKILKMWSQMGIFNKPLLEILMEKINNNKNILEKDKNTETSRRSRSEKQEESTPTDSKGGLPPNILAFLSNIPTSESNTPSDSSNLKRERSYDDRDRARDPRDKYRDRERSTDDYESNKRTRIDPRTRRPIENHNETKLYNQQTANSPINQFQENNNNINYTNSDLQNNNKTVDALANFNWSQFDPIQPAAWIMAGKAFEKTFGFVPSNEQIGSCAFMWVYYTNMQNMQLSQQQQPQPQPQQLEQSESRSRSRTPEED
ncbi:hypothetical protein E3Q23_02457 [Wallemia mellicola]|uniref:CID domain-containing protein n=1 Tax=Wallemia mellicola TaxID=1708541 RepID=A0A4T0LNY9_9BASI|nr:hypothetical protein E3Q24_02370 [Wallemia mellicola]TIB75048.1 hypothetical protein E3Q23_02457 [Wallemia mellicola]TIC22380.1 hypothetical protein E3Q12_02708 [Wallemia mellicola]TIC29827.1 hypothetical protein E3Q10_02424 [Wallemia mellicola]TIC45377.1 hypothetical protein E3Q08_01331 [Wallemia mellicola]